MTGRLELAVSGLSPGFLHSQCGQHAMMLKGALQADGSHPGILAEL